MPGVTIRVREGGRFMLPPSLDTPGFRERIIRYTAYFPFEVVTLDRRGLRAGNVVGSLDFGKLRLEILPEASATSLPEEDAQFLLNLLADAGVLSRSTVTSGRVRYVPGAAIEPLIVAFANRLLQRLSDGLPRRYSPREEWSPVLRGRINFSAQAGRVPGRDHLLPIRHTPLQPVNPLTHLVRSVVGYLLGASRSARSRSILLACDQMLSDVPRVPLTAEVVQRVHLSSLETRWQDVVELAEALVQSKAPDPTSAGRSRLFSMIFSMDDLFERVLRRNLRDTLAGADVELGARPHRLHLLHSAESGAMALPMKPDFLFHRRGEPTVQALVGDAKWKRLDASSRSFGLKPADVYQLATYMASYSLPRGLFFFPRVEWMASGWSHTFRIAGRDASIRVVAVDTPALVSPDRTTREQAIHKLRSAVDDTLVLSAANSE